jgi:hypothetical protein
MIPPRISPATRSGAERRLFEELGAVDLPQDWVCMHSVDLPDHLYKVCGELDFVVVGPRGLYVLEVKGGGVSCDGGIWRFTDRWGRVRSLLIATKFRNGNTTVCRRATTAKVGDRSLQGKPAHDESARRRDHFRGGTVEELTKEQHDYLMAACQRMEGKGSDEVFTGEGIVTESAGINASREPAILLALREAKLVDFDSVYSGQITITAAGRRYCERHGDGNC